MAVSDDTFVSIGPDWYNIFKQDNGQILVKPCPGVMKSVREEEIEGRAFIVRNRSYSGFVQFSENGVWNYASNYKGYVGTFHIPDFHELDDTTFKERYVEQIASLGWVIE